jgi:hypothetical protein
MESTREDSSREAFFHSVLAFIAVVPAVVVGERVEVVVVTEVAGGVREGASSEMVAENDDVVVVDSVVLCQNTCTWYNSGIVIFGFSYHTAS